MMISLSTANALRAFSVEFRPLMRIPAEEIATVIASLASASPMFDSGRLTSVILSGEPKVSRKKIWMRNMTSTSGVTSNAELFLYFFFFLNLMVFTFQVFEDPGRGLFHLKDQEIAA